MSKSSILTAALLPIVLGGCQGAIFGNLLVLGISVGIFVATLSLGRSAETSSRATRSAETSSTQS
jgi:hypothetical protein